VTGSDRPALRAARRARGWSQAAAARELAALAHATGGPGATPASLKSLLSRWENGHAVPDPHYRGLLGELYGRTAIELELAGADPGRSDAVTQLRARLAAAAAVDSRLFRAWADQLAVARRLDDEVGAAGAAGLLRALVDELDRTLVHSLDPHGRAEVGFLLAQAATLAGWQELDLGDPEQAWLRFDRARTAATATGPTAAVAGAEATAGLAAVLVDVGDPDAAVALIDHTVEPTTAEARAWLAAARGTALAAGGHDDEARRGFDAADRALSTRAGPGDRPEASAGTGSDATGLRAADLCRWRGHALALLGDPDAISTLEAALAAGVRSARERAAAHAALAVALTTEHAVAAAEHARTARALAERIGSTRAITLLTAGRDSP